MHESPCCARYAHNVGDGLDRPYLVVDGHDGDQQSPVADQPPQLRDIDDAIAIDWGLNDSEAGVA